ncbi:nodal homolog [Lethenteron reissneri]|uniref:nodal homolog n=1 Tax=Lethenteron reissneri TaxID=7753 RepID=UPI002AB5F473|nr:nodal homolog [Lethenteron reissneri]
MSFEQIGWDAWVIQPKRFNAYRCEGPCPSPVGERFQPTNHAYMQSLLRFFKPDKVPPPCCIPTRLSSLSILYHEENTVRVMHHRDMVVEECGCH